MEDVPLFYVVSRHLPIEQVEVVLRIMRITPCFLAVISRVQDAALGLSVAPDVANAASDEDALALAKKMAIEIERPVIVVGEADFLDAVWADGRRESLASHA
jgi:hypothetical protein